MSKIQYWKCNFEVDNRRCGVNISTLLKTLCFISHNNVNNELVECILPTKQHYKERALVSRIVWKIAMYTSRYEEVLLINEKDKVLLKHVCSGKTSNSGPQKRYQPSIPTTK